MASKSEPLERPNNEIHFFGFRVSPLSSGTVFPFLGCGEGGVLRLQERQCAISEIVRPLWSARFRTPGQQSKSCIVSNRGGSARRTSWGVQGFLGKMEFFPVKNAGVAFFLKRLSQSKNKLGLVCKVLKRGPKSLASSGPIMARPLCDRLVFWLFWSV